ncbi:MAG: hypothetical protein IKS31_10125 [Clostridia bacterium]|nr:hypothetical protein [Clostridia bacterium]
MNGQQTAWITVLIGVAAIGLIIVWYYAARSMADIARDKGYTEKKWFHFCFWLGLAGFLMVVAMPDRNGQPVPQTWKAWKPKSGELPQSYMPVRGAVSDAGSTWFCEGCMSYNDGDTDVCRQCGAPRRKT